MILVEGLDNTGKTTLVQDLCNRYPVLTSRPSIGNKHDLDQIKAAAFEEAYGSMPYLLVADRSRIISEWIYNPVLNAREPAYDFDMWLFMLKGFVQKPLYVIHCWRDLDNIRSSFDERDQLGGVAEHLPELAQKYEHVMGMIDLFFDLQQRRPVMWYNYEVDNPDLIYREVEAYIKEGQ